MLRNSRSLCFLTLFTMGGDSWNSESKRHDNREHIYQIMTECDKNHKEDDVGESNEARIYANPGKN